MDTLIRQVEKPIAQTIQTDKPKKEVTILYIEDNKYDVRLVQDLLKESSEFNFNFIVADRLEKVFDIKYPNKIDLILLDLYLPDSAGLETVEKIHFCFHEIPIIVTTGLKDNEVGISAIKIGAQDYLIKGEDYYRLPQAINFAIERHRLQNESLELLREEYFENEMKSLETIASSSKDNNPEISLDRIPPEIFNDLISRFKHVAEYFPLTSSNHTNIVNVHSKNLRKIAEAIGFLGGGTKDIFKIYIGSVRRKVKNSSIIEQEVFLQRAHLSVLELMGHLINYYQRTQTFLNVKMGDNV